MKNAVALPTWDLPSLAVELPESALLTALQNLGTAEHWSGKTVLFTDQVTGLLIFCRVIFEVLDVLDPGCHHPPPPHLSHSSSCIPDTLASSLSLHAVFLFLLLFFKFFSCLTAF